MTETNEARIRAEEARVIYRETAVEELGRRLGNALANFTFAVEDQRNVYSTEILLSGTITKHLSSDNDMDRISAIQAILRAPRSTAGDR